MMLLHRRASAAVGGTGDAVVQRRLVDDLSTRGCQLVYRCYSDMTLDVLPFAVFNFPISLLLRLQKIEAIVHV